MGVEVNAEARRVVASTSEVSSRRCLEEAERREASEEERREAVQDLEVTEEVEDRQVDPLEVGPGLVDTEVALKQDQVNTLSYLISFWLTVKARIKVTKQIEIMIYSKCL
jgi:hypothetical protein